MRVQRLIKISGMFFLFGCAILGSGCGPILAEKALENGATFEQKGQFAEAMAEYNRAIELDPKSTNAYYNRALLYQRQGNSKVAFSDFDKITEINPNFSEPYYGRGQLYDGESKRDKAIAEYTKAIENNVNYGLAYYKRGMDYNFKGEYRKALDDIEKAKAVGIKIAENVLRELQANASRQR